MEDLQSTLQSILSDPEQMQRIAAMAESLGLKPPEGNAASAQTTQSAASVSPGSGTPRPQPDATGSAGSEATAPFALGGMDLSTLMGSLSAMQGTEDRVFTALRPSLSPAGQSKADRAVRAAKLAKLASRFLTRQRNGHV